MVCKHSREWWEGNKGIHRRKGKERARCRELSVSWKRGKYDDTVDRESRIQQKMKLAKAGEEGAECARNREGQATSNAGRKHDNTR